MTRTLANLSQWLPERVEGLRDLLEGATAGAAFTESFDITRSLPHGHVAAILGTLQRRGRNRLMDRTASVMRNRVAAMIVARILAPASKLATMRGMASETAATTLGAEL
ncbi:MAG: hypothetical protein OXE84_15080 [Rhodobacteraceae bacterium]|nr:hypothetical protein [Paracoccaceae bacterium]MCY4197243.1 hypothetical protein [Paracoccaceae bacterium]